MSQPTPEEAARALRDVQHRQAQVVRGAGSPRWLWIALGVLLAAYNAILDLLPDSAVPWATWIFVAVLLAASFGTRTRLGASLLGQVVRPVGNRVAPVWRLVYMLALIIGTSAVVLLVQALHLPHGRTVYGVICGLYLALLGPKVQAWVLARRARA